MSIAVKLMSHFTHFENAFRWFSGVTHEELNCQNIPKRGCALYTQLRSIHHFQGLNKWCVLNMGASYTHKIMVVVFFISYFSQS